MDGSRVRFLEQWEKRNTRSMYENIFTGDSQEFIDYYYGWKVRDNEILVMEGEREQAGGYQVMLHLNPFDLCINGNVRRIPYIVAVATRPDCRRQGKMQQVMREALRHLDRKQAPFTFLMPADPAYYQGQGFVYFPRQQDAVFSECADGKSGIRQRETQTLAFREMEIQDIPALAEASNRILQEQYQIYIRRDGAYYNRLLAEVAAEDGAILVLESENGIQGSAVFGKSEGAAELKELLAPERRKQQAFQTLAETLGTTRIQTGSFPVMVRIVNIMALIPLLRSRTFCRYQVNVRDSEIQGNNGCFRIELSADQGRIERDSHKEEGQKMDIAKLAELLFCDTSVYLHEWV